ncbi:hypothetical protein DL96DRAFT_1771876, partial [Flagelloscypha sp. PMI_526]
YRPFYEEEHFNVLVEAVSSFFSSNPNPVQFHDLTCFANDESTSSMRENLFMDFVLRTSTNSTTKGDVTFILQLMSMEDFPIDSEEAIFTFLDCLTLEKIEKLTLEGYDIQLPSQLWKFNETLQTLVLDNIERSFLDWASLPPTSKNHPNFSTLVIRNEQSSADFPLDLVINLLSFCNRETGTPLPLLIVEGKYLPAFKPSVLLHLGVIERVEYKNGLEAGLTNEEDSVASTETVSFEEEDTDESDLNSEKPSAFELASWDEITNTENAA